MAINEERARQQKIIEKRELYKWEQEKRRLEAQTSSMEAKSKRVNDVIDADIRASDNISEGVKSRLQAIE
ncbi:hypothetical protein AB8613_23910 [Vibrio sp. BS-M-Sm-2]|uniref:hypothetical protein n=1 Tax=Vibrio sp. BS-M-Sm-2 TaxID=3241167 RepID=UPI0035563137